jgi:hypothetical protein
VEYAAGQESAMVVIGNFRRGAELRKKPRRNFHHSARILIDGKNPPRSCLISDISESGARLVLKSDDELPERFTLLLSKAGDVRRICRVVWRAGLNIGVRFPDDRSRAARE